MRIQTALSWACYWSADHINDFSQWLWDWSLTLQGKDVRGPWGASDDWDADLDNHDIVPADESGWAAWPDAELEQQLKLFDALHELGNGYDKEHI